MVFGGLDILGKLWRVRDKSSVNDSMDKLGLDIMELRLRMKDFWFGQIRVWFDAKQPCFKLVLMLNVFWGEVRDMHKFRVSLSYGYWYLWLLGRLKVFENFKNVYDQIWKDLVWGWKIGYGKVKDKMIRWVEVIEG